MPLQFPETTKVAVTNTNPRREFHGDDKVRAIDITCCITGENTLLDLIEPGLRAHHYYNKAATAGQEPLPGVVVHMPNLRYPALPLTYTYALPGKKVRGYRWLRDYGTDEDRVDFTDAALGNVHYEIAEGGTVKVFFTISYNGDELEDNDLYGMLSGLSSEGEIYMKLLAPPELLPAKKGYRAGRPDTPAPAASPGQATLDEAAAGEDGDGEQQDEGGDGGELDPSTPEGAFAGGGTPAAEGGAE